MTSTGLFAHDAPFDNAADDLAGEAGAVEKALARDDEIGRLDAVVEFDVVGHGVHAGRELSAQHHQTSGQPAGGAGPGLIGQVYAVVVSVTIEQREQTAFQQLDLRRRRALLRARTRARRR